jgi:hypothetical protein
LLRNARELWGRNFGAVSDPELPGLKEAWPCHVIINQVLEDTNMSRVLEGTWEELSVYAATFRGKRLRLIVGDDETTSRVSATEEARIAGIRSGLGRFADPARTTLASEELRRERQQDDARLEPNTRVSQ